MNTLLLRRTTLAAAVCAAICASQLDASAQFGGGTRNNNAGTAARTSSTSTYPSATEIGTPTVTVNPETREVFVIADEETAAYVRNVIDELDRPTPQVLIKCVFLEATYTKDSDIGVEGVYRHTISGAGEFSGDGTGGTAFDLAGGIAGGIPTGAGGIYNLVGNDLEITLSALAKAGKTEILSRPSILARNNQPATISLGQQVPLITNTRFDNFGNQINTVTYQDVGIILNVTPFITEDDLVEMVVAPQISQLTDRSQWVPISGGTSNSAAVVSAPVINSRSADTVVIVPDGQTVVIGGLMQNTKLDSTEKVPLLGDIPLLGMLFRHKVKNDAKTELMIFMTPHIVRRPSDLLQITASERAKSQVSKKAFSETDLNRYLDNLPAEEQPDEKK